MLGPARGGRRLRGDERAADARRRRPAGGPARQHQATARRPLASITACPTCAAKPRAVAITPRTKSSEEACAMSVSRDAGGPAGGSRGPRGDRRGRPAAVSRSGGGGPARRRSGRPEGARGGCELEGEAAVAAGVVDRGADERALGAGHDEASRRRPTGGAGLVDDALGEAVRLAGREDGLPVRVQRGRPAGVRERDPRRGLEDAVAQPARTRSVRIGPTTPISRKIGSSPISSPQSGVDERRGEREEVGPELVRGCR